MAAKRARLIMQALAEIAGLVLIPAGVWFIYWPAALIVAGCLLIAASFMVQRSREGSERE